MSDTPDEATAGNGARSDGLPAAIPVSTVDSFERLTYETDSQRYRTRFDTRVDPPSLAVIAAVAAVAGVAVTDLAPLSQVVDPDALDTLLCSAGDDGESTVGLSFAGHEVTVSRQGRLSVSDGSDS